MTFERPWILLFTLLPLIWVWWSWKRSDRRVALLLKGLAFAAIVAALAEPVMTVHTTKVAAAVLVDTSASVSEADLRRASELAGQIEQARGRNWIRVIPFAQSIREPNEQEYESRAWKLTYTAGTPGRATDFESGIREGLAALPSGMIPRLVLISDGHENSGSVLRAAWQAQRLGIPIDTYALPGRPQPRLRVESVSFPNEAFAGERFPVELTVLSDARARARLTLKAEGNSIGEQALELDRGTNRVVAQANLNSTGAVELAGTLSSEGLGNAEFSQAIHLRRPKVLILTQDPEGSEVHLQQVLDQAQFEVDYASRLDPKQLEKYQIVVFNNQDTLAIPESDQQQIEAFVRRGGGVLLIGGERNVYVEKTGPESPLERALPAKIAPPRTPQGTAVVLIIDKSSSMEGKKMELARLAAIGVVDNLRAVDMVGVLIFDNSFQWTVPIRKAQDRTMIKRLISGIVADGGTQIAPALAEAYRRILPVNAVYKHVVLLTDGISEEGDSMALAREATRNRVTISTVGLGQDVNRAYLEKVAEFASGKSYLLRDPSALEQILIKDVQEHTGTTTVERAIRAEVVKKAEILEDLDLENAPTLAGYVKFESKPTSDTILTVERDPLLVRWQYGLGRAAVFTSDAKSRWATRWVGWEGYGKFWENVFRDLLPHARATEATVTLDPANSELIAEYRLSRGTEAPRTIPDIFVIGPGGFQRPIEVTKVSEGAYRGRLRIGDRRGLFRIRPFQENPAFPEVGFYRKEEELNDYGSNEQLLRQIAEYTGGRFQPAPSAVFDGGGLSIPSVFRLWPALLVLAILLNLAELIMRKWPGIWQTLRRA
jgi:Ca-activated chloride channel homolog